ncbi:L-threonylcarbamoyladenylate synthase [Brevibacillus migulae]|uniref:L-threonylcarbamoyladenylate synthase n=1 Tax=Brevibacillus migulae TaxID=1644114 RepID=UPI00106E473A|nr:L-threonylcarbamoyladenylate synthase [Brevibacillus migulae]
MDRIVETKLWNVDKNVEDLESCSQVVDAAHLIREGELVAFPTETVYGLGANAFSDEAVEKIYHAKGRPSDNPLIVHIGDMDQLHEVAREVPEMAYPLIERFWPGPLTLLLPKAEKIATQVTKLDTVGVRMPDHPLALALIRAARVPIAAPSANRSGRPSPTMAEHVRQDLDGRIAAILDGGETGVGVESTVLDLTVSPPMILRPGGITREQLHEVLGDVAIDPAFEAKAEHVPRSPGMKYTHYAPQGELWLVDGSPEQAQKKMEELIREAKANGLSTGVLATDETIGAWRKNGLVDAVLSCGSRQDPSSIAQLLYARLREFDDLGIQYMVGETFPKQGLGMAVMNRLEKAAGGRIISV